ncbi:cupin domain-containing protein [Bradyrhizobium sp. INPA03-11B]|uniref:cupin domain-containing protein n=1 Tax=Bradyrhizobium sp. INPA03-11B TaxID=418598 RepID=UPI00338FC2F7
MQTSPRSIDNVERFALLLAGTARLAGEAIHNEVCAGEFVFIPAGVVASLVGEPNAVWVEIEAPLASTAPTTAIDGGARVVTVDDRRFEGHGFAYQTVMDRAQGAHSMRINLLEVQPGAGSPDYHIHTFAQIYLILEGEMTLEIGGRRTKAGAHTLVFLPPGVVHRNFNASRVVERHVSFLVPEPNAGEIFDYAVTIHDKEAELLRELPV